MTLQELYDWAAKENATDYKVVVNDNSSIYELRDVEIETNYIDHKNKVIYLNWN